MTLQLVPVAPPNHAVPIELGPAAGLVEHTTRAFLAAAAKAGGPPMEKLPLADARMALVAAQAGVKPDPFAVEVSERTIHCEGRTLELTLVRPAGLTGPLPVFLFFHGGGWVLGDYPTHERLLSDLVVGAGVAAVFLDYSRSPEVRYPIALEEAYAATRWVAENGASLNLDGTRLAVGGNSAGANLATVVCLLAKERGGPAIRHQTLLWPVTDARSDTDSYRQFAAGHFLTADMMRWFWDSYLPDAGKRADAHVSPLRATQEQLTGLPPALILTAECDVLRDEGEAYGRRLDAAGVEVTTTRYNGMIHDFGLLNALAQVPAVRSALRQASAELKRHLE
jgi:acetyl esterase/lipase